MCKNILCAFALCFITLLTAGCGNSSSSRADRVPGITNTEYGVVAVDTSAADILARKGAKYAVGDHVSYTGGDYTVSGVVLVSSNGLSRLNPDIRQIKYTLSYITDKGETATVPSLVNEWELSITK